MQGVPKNCTNKFNVVTSILSLSEYLLAISVCLKRFKSVSQKMTALSRLLASNFTVQENGPQLGLKIPNNQY